MQQGEKKIKIPFILLCRQLATPCGGQGCRTASPPGTPLITALPSARQPRAGTSLHVAELGGPLLRTKQHLPPRPRRACTFTAVVKLRSKRDGSGNQRSFCISLFYLAPQLLSLHERVTHTEPRAVQDRTARAVQIRQPPATLSTGITAASLPGSFRARQCTPGLPQTQLLS